jgi:hypothetical protein
MPGRPGMASVLLRVGLTKKAAPEGAAATSLGSHKALPRELNEWTPVLFPGQASAELFMMLSFKRSHRNWTAEIKRALVKLFDGLKPCNGNQAPTARNCS